MNLNELDPTIETFLLQASDDEAELAWDDFMRRSARLGLLRATEIEIVHLLAHRVSQKF